MSIVGRKKTDGTKRSSVLLCILIAAAGIGLLAYLAPRAHPAAHWNVSCDGEQSQVRAREISAALGVDPAGWDATVIGTTDTKAGYRPIPRFSPVFPKVALKAPTGAARIVVALSASGDVNSWEWRGYPKSPAIGAAQARALAESALSKIAGRDAAAAFHPVKDPEQSGTALLFAYERPAPMAQRFEATVDGSSLVKAELTAVYTRDVSGALNARKKYINWFSGAVAVIIYFLGTVLAACVYVFWAVRHAVRHRFVFALSATSILWGAIYWSNWMGYTARYDSVAGSDSFVQNFFGGVAVQVLLIIFYVILAGSADAIGLRPKLTALRSVFSASTFSRPAGRSILAGLLCGPLVAALPLAVSSLHLFGSQQTGDYDPSLMYSAHPWLQALDVMVPTALIGVFGFGTGFLARYVRKTWLAAAILATLGILLFCTAAVPTETAPAAFLLGGTLLFLAYYQIFLRLDLLAVLSTGWCVQVLWNALAEFLQPAPSLHGSGIAAFSCLAALAGCAALVAWRGRELTLDDDVAPAVVTSRREALMNEFSIAHRVQQQMLPASPPEIPGCTVAASCQPAQEVGGDLFDFLQLPDGRWTIGVGDVSGKGVPADLYMTLTKGLLVATTQDSSDLLDIIGNVNGHIHAATERKTFVTMALGAFDPATHIFDNVRAGHNPIVWRRAALDQTSLLNAPGLGLGIVSDRLFRRSVKLDRLQLSSGDALVFYSDGLTEAMNIEREQFGEERLMRVVADGDGLDAGRLRESIEAGVTEFLAGVAPQDDMTIVVLRVN